MIGNIIGALLAFALGIAVAFFNYILARQILLKRPDMYGASAIMRQIIQVVFLVTVYFVGDHVSVSLWYLLIGAVLGITLPLFYFTKKLLKLSASMRSNEIEDEKEGAGNG